MKTLPSVKALTICCVMLATSLQNAGAQILQPPELPESGTSVDEATLLDEKQLPELPVRLGDDDQIAMTCSGIRESAWSCLDLLTIQNACTQYADDDIYLDLCEKAEKKLSETLAEKYPNAADPIGSLQRGTDVRDNYCALRTAPTDPIKIGACKFDTAKGTTSCHISVSHYQGPTKPPEVSYEVCAVAVFARSAACK